MTIDAYQLSAMIGEHLHGHGLTCATAESITGGLIGHYLTLVPGSSDYFLGGIIAYSNAAKVSLLDVTEETLKQAGAVSDPCATEMAHGARAALRADIGMACTGIAGPGGATARKPVGLVYICVATPADTRTQELRLDGDRAANIHETAMSVLRLTSSLLTGTPDAR